MTASGDTAGVTADALVVGGETFFNVADSAADAPSVRTSNVQVYNGPVQLQTDTVLASTAGGMVGALAAGNITFNSTVDGAYRAGSRHGRRSGLQRRRWRRDSLDQPAIAGGQRRVDPIQYDGFSGGTAGVTAGSLRLTARPYFNVAGSTLAAPVCGRAPRRPTTAPFNYRQYRTVEHRRRQHYLQFHGGRLA